MTFTYDITTACGQVRLALGDTTSGSGVRPDGSNFSDAEIAYFLAQEEQSVDGATARACEVLATQWATQADLTVGPRSESLSQIAERYAERAKSIRSSTAQTGYITLGSSETWSDGVEY